jgi:plastocyanin
MRAITLVAGAALVLGACGGEKKAEQQPATPAGQEAAPAAAPAATGAVHEVQMEFDGKKAWYDPDTLTIKPGDVVKWIVKSGPPHNVTFDPKAGLPSGADSWLQGAMKETIGPLSGPLKVTMGDSYEINFTGAPAGVYHYYCTPHLPFGMKATLTVQ